MCKKMKTLTLTFLHYITLQTLKGCLRKFVNGLKTGTKEPHVMRIIYANGPKYGKGNRCWAHSNYCQGLGARARGGLLWIDAREICITGSTVVLTCCKGDSSSQWETPIFGPPQTENPLTDLDKICHQ